MKRKLFLLSLFLSFICAVCPVLAQSAQRIRVGLYVDHGARARPQIFATLASDRSVSAKIIDGEDIRAGCLRDLDVLFMPGGSGRKQAMSLAEGAANVCRFVKNGGIYLGVCAGCYLASCIRPQYLGIMPVTSIDKEHWKRGKAILPIEFTRAGMEVFGVHQAMADVLYHNGPIMQIYKGYENEVIPLCYFRDEIVGAGGKPGVMINSPAMILYRYGNGLVLGISPHPEATEGLNQIELSAIHWLYDHRRPNKSTSSVTIVASPYSPKTVVSTLSSRFYNKAEEVFENTVSSHYEHLHEGAIDQVQRFGNRYSTTTDCSGFVSYVLKDVAPNHYYTLCEMTRRSYPHAATYARFFKDLNGNKSINGWLGISSYRSLQRGDVIAWERTHQSSGYQKKHGSGHVMIVINPPGKPITENFQGMVIKYVEVYVLDSSAVEHFPPQLLPPLANQNQRDGVGKGMIRLILDDQNNVIGFWEGTFSREKNARIKGPSYTNRIGFARLISNVSPQ
jgi:hypothetical protein